ncbi:MAG: hypothetical protein Fur006_36070 [Coleofasciculaceae cyanobacterium]
MNIENLDYLETVAQTSHLIGAGGAYTNAFTYTTNGFAYARGDAIAIGNSTSADSKTFTKVKSSPANNVSKATAKTTATAQTGNSSYYSSSTSRSWYIS